MRLGVEVLIVLLETGESIRSQKISAEFKAGWVESERRNPENHGRSPAAVAR